MVVVSMYVAASPKSVRAAAWEKVPSGPRYAIFSGSCSARHALITSRYTARIASAGDRAHVFRRPRRAQPPPHPCATRGGAGGGGDPPGAPPQPIEDLALALRI